MNHSLDPSRVFHLISRVVNREIRIVEPRERDAYLQRIPRALARSDWKLLGLSIMGNHIHWCMLAGNSQIGPFFQSLHGSYARWLNTRQERFGPLFAGRPKRLRFDQNSVAVLLAYIHNNPVRAGVVTDAANCDWSTHRAYIGEIAPPPWLDISLGLSICGFSADRRGMLDFRAFVRARAGEPRSPVLSGDGEAKTRRDVREQTRAPLEIESRVEQLRPTYGVLARPHTPMYRDWNGSPRTVLDACARASGVSENEARSKTRRRQVVAARRLALLVWTRYLGGAQVDMAATAGISAAAASQLLSRPEAVSSLDGVAERIARGLGRPGPPTSLPPLGQSPQVG